MKLQETMFRSPVMDGLDPAIPIISHGRATSFPSPSLGRAGWGASFRPIPGLIKGGKESEGLEGAGFAP
jgi:hypothetical protein